MRIRDFLDRGRRNTFESQLDEELAYHVDRVADDLVARGVDPEEARREALERFGALDRHRAAMIRMDRRDARRIARRVTWEGILAGVLLGMRRLRRAPGFTLNTVAILGLGIGANAVMFGVVDRLLLRPPQHIADADAVRKIYLQRTFPDGTTRLGQTLTFPDYLDLTGADALTRVGAWADWGEMVLGRNEAAQEVRVKVATASFFQALGVAPALGRFFTPGEDAPGAPTVAVLSAEFQERHFGGREDVLGQVLDVGTGRYEIIGVAPRGFTGADLGHVDVWLPLEAAQAIRFGETGWLGLSRSNWWVHIVGRMAPDATDASAAAEATARHRAARRELIDTGRYSADATLIPASLITARGPDPGQESQVAIWLAGVSLIVLLIACFNAANLLLARATVAERETALRLAMGAGRGRLIGEVLTESTVLAALGGLVALALAAVLGDALHRTLLPGVAFTDTDLGWRVGAFALAASIFTGVGAGLLPALQSTRADVALALKSGARGVASASSRTRLVLLVGQATMSVLLLVGAGLFVKSLNRARALDLGFDATVVAVVDLTWTDTLPGAERSEVFHRVLERLRGLPQVQHAGLTYTVPFRSSISLGAPRVPGLDSFPRHPSGGPYVNKVGAGYFETMGLEIRQGRAFDDADGGEGAEPVAIVSESMARALWPDTDAVGQCLIFDEEAREPVCTRVAGVVENHRRQDLLEDDPHFLYFVNESHPAFQGPPQALMARIGRAGTGTLPLLAREARGVSPLIRFAEAHPLQDHVDPQLRSWRLGASMFTAFGVLALVVAAWGLYSVLAFEVARRRREMGIRSALGAGAGRIVGLVVRRSLALGLGGIGLGLLLAAAAGRFIEPLLFDVPATDPAVYLTVAGALLMSATLAALFPAWRATTVQPTEALRAE